MERVELDQPETAQEEQIRFDLPIENSRSEGLELTVGVPWFRPVFAAGCLELAAIWIDSERTPEWNESLALRWARKLAEHPLRAGLGWALVFWSGLQLWRAWRSSSPSKLVRPGAKA